MSHSCKEPHEAGLYAGLLQRPHVVSAQLMEKNVIQLGYINLIFGGRSALSALTEADDLFRVMSGI